MERSPRPSGNKLDVATILEGEVVLNTQAPLTEQAARLWEETTSGYACYQFLPPETFVVSRNPYITVSSRIVHLDVSDGTEKSGEFDSWFVGTVPIGEGQTVNVLLSPSRVQELNPGDQV